MSEHAAMYENQHLRLKQCRRGVMMYFANDKYVGRSFDLYGEFSEGEIALFGQILKPGMTVVDAGANIGAHTIYFGTAVGPKGLVLAFEPQPVIHHMLCGNIALNLLHNTRAFNIGLGKEMTGWRPPTIDYSLGANFGGISIETSSGGQTVEIRTLDSFDLAACHMIKIDVEGMERDVLIGAEATIAKHRPIIYVENDRDKQSPALIAWLLEKQYRPYWHLAQLFNPNNSTGNKENVFSGIVSINMICAPAELNIKMTDLREITSVDDHWRRA